MLLLNSGHLITRDELTLKFPSSLLFLLILLPIYSFADNGLLDNSNPCVSNDPEMGDSAAWAVGAMKLYEEKKFIDAINRVNSCFNIWGPEAGQKQKIIHDKGKSCPKIGKVSSREKRKIDKNYLMNDVSVALWVKARSLHELNEIELAKKSYGRCVYMTCGRSWDRNGWFWSPANDCASYARELVD